MKKDLKNKKKKKNEIKEAIKVLKSKKVKPEEKFLYFGAILEHVDRNVEMILEGYSALDTKFTKEINELKDKIRIINLKLDAHSEELRAHAKILQEHMRILQEHRRLLEEHSRMLEELQKDVTIIKMDVIWLKGALSRKVDFDDFLRLEKRVALLEKKIK